MVGLAAHRQRSAERWTRASALARIILIHQGFVLNENASAEVRVKHLAERWR